MTRDPSRDRPDDDRLVDPALDDAWRGHSREAPSPDLDATILAAAHRAASASPRDAALAEAREPERWWWPLAAAAAIGAIAFGVIQVLPPERDPASVVVTDAPRPRNAAPATQPRDAQPAPATAGEPPAAPAPQPATTSRSTESREMAATSPPSQGAQAKADAAHALAPEPKATVSRERTDVRTQPEAPAKVSAFVDRAASAPIAPSVVPPASVQTAPVPAPASPPPPMPAAAPAPPPPPPPPPPPAPPAETARPSSALPAAPPQTSVTTTPRAFPGEGTLEKAVVGATAQRPAPRLDASRDRAQASGDAKPETSAAVPTNPAQWIERIRTLRRDGREQEAQAALREFRAAYADADTRLPEELRAWAATVKR